MNYCQKRFQGIPFFSSVMNRKPNAFAHICGSQDYPDIHGMVHFYQTRCGVLVVSEVFGLPVKSDMCSSPIFAFHIHEGCECTGTSADPFADAKGHYNPDNCLHPYHAGDMPPLFGNNGYAFASFLTERFCVREVIGRTVIIHRDPDDFMTQPSGNAGAKIACGIIQWT